MTETAKEKIKRKKKEREQALLNEPSRPAEEPKVEAQVEETSQQKESVEILEIYPASKHKPKWIAQGTVKIKMHDVGLEIRNIVYSIHPSHQVEIQPPFRYYRFPDEPEKPDAYIESIKFDDKDLWKNACKVIRSAVLEHHREELLKVEELVEKQPS